MDTVDLGAARLHVVTALPGLPGDADRVLREIASVDPAVILADLDTDECLRLIESLGRSNKPYARAYVDDLLEEELNARFGEGRRAGESPMVAAARHARKHHASFIPLRPVTSDPGWLARRRGRKAVRALPAGLDPLDLADAFAIALRERKVWRAEEDVAASQPRLHRTLTDGRAPIVALVQAHRVAPFLLSLRAVGRVPA